MRLLTLILITAISLKAADVIPSTNLYTAGWQTAGVVGGMPDTSGRTVHATITSTGDTTDRTTAINNAISACPSGQVVVLGAGTFRVNNRINFNNESGVTLRGQGIGVTILDSRSGSDAVFMGNGNSDWPWDADGTELSADEAQGQTVLSMVSTTAYSVGNHIRLSQDPDLTLPVIDISDVNNRIQWHNTTITAKDASTITIRDPLPFALKTSLNASAHVFLDTFTTDCGIENMTIDCDASTTPTVGIKMWSTYNCWLYNVRVIRPYNQGIYMMVGLHNTVQKCYFDGIQNDGSNGAGVLVERSSMNLFQDNIIYDSFPNLEQNFGCTGNVYAYNLWDKSEGQEGAWGMSVNMNHGGHNSYNLYEGNVTPSFQPDGYFGSVSHDTIFRNRAHGYQSYNDAGDTLGSVAIKLKRFTRYYNVVGNILGVPRASDVYEHSTSGQQVPAIYQLGYPNIGNHTFTGTAEPSTGDNWADWRTSTGPSGYQERDLDVGNSLLRKGNWNAYDAAIPDSESVGSDTYPNSYYLSSKPSWFYGLTWPPFDPTNPVTNLVASVEAIPAGYRFLNSLSDPPSNSDPQPGTASAQTARVGTLRGVQ